MNRLSRAAPHGLNATLHAVSTSGSIFLRFLEPFGIYGVAGFATGSRSQGWVMSVLHQTDTGFDRRAPLSLSVLVIAGLSALSWALMIALIRGLWAAL